MGSVSTPLREITPIQHIILDSKTEMRKRSINVCTYNDDFVKILHRNVNIIVIGDRKYQINEQFSM